MNIPITKTYFDEEDIKNVEEVIRSGWIVQGEKVKEFEKLFCDFSGAKHSVAVSSCTTALHLSLLVAGIGEGDEVILPSFTWIATANAVEYVKAKPVFCDISLDTYNIDVNKIERLINERTKCILPVHLFGLPAEMEKINEIAKEYNLKIIEDSACGFGGELNKKHTGNFGNFGCFSFHPRKSITTGEGGIITVDNEKDDRYLRSLRDHGASTSDLQRHLGSKPYLLPDFPYAGYNYRMTDIQAALGLGQLKRGKQIVQKRREIAEKYDEILEGIDWLKKIKYSNEYSNGYQSYVCLFSPEEITLDKLSDINTKRNNFMQYLFDNGISTRPGTHAVHLQDYYSKKYNLRKEDLPKSYIANECSIALPFYTTIADEEINYMFEHIKNYKLK